jgi:ParB/RepB/Spo0J family partition protein
LFRAFSGNYGSEKVFAFYNKLGTSIDPLCCSGSKLVFVYISYRTIFIQHIYPKNGIEVVAVALKTQVILLLNIALDPFFEKDEEERLTKSINKDGLLNPLVVEAHSDKKYMLVDGYKRYASLMSLGWREVSCIVEDASDPAQLIAKKLERDYIEHKMRNPERVRLVHKLLNLKWTTERIAKETGISKSVIDTYAKIKDIPQERKDIVKSLGLGQEGLLSLENIHLKLSSKNYIIVLDILKSYEKLHAYNIKSVEYLTKVPGFDKLSKPSIQRAVYKAINESKFNASSANETVVIEQVISDTSSEARALGIALEYLLQQTEEVNRLITPRLVHFAPSIQKKKLISNLEFGLKNAKSSSHSWR